MIKEPLYGRVIAAGRETPAHPKPGEKPPVAHGPLARGTVGYRNARLIELQQAEEVLAKGLFHEAEVSRIFATSSIANLLLDINVTKSHKSDMAKSLKDLVLARLTALGITSAEAARRGGFTRTFINDIVVGRKKSVAGKHLPNLAQALETSTAYLLGEAVDPDEVASPPQIVPLDATLRQVVVAGIVEAGSFRMVDELNDSTPEPFLEPRDEMFPRARLLAFDVAGDSMNALSPRPIFPGDRVICVAFEDVEDRLPLRDGMIVVVERSRDSGMMREWSIKQIELYDDRIEFHPRSTNPKHKPIVVRRDPHSDDGIQISIIGLVRRVSNAIPLSQYAS